MTKFHVKHHRTRRPDGASRRVYPGPPCLAPLATSDLGKSVPVSGAFLGGA